MKLNHRISAICVIVIIQLNVGLCKRIRVNAILLMFFCDLYMLTKKPRKLRFIKEKTELQIYQNNLHSCLVDDLFKSHKNRL